MRLGTAMPAARADGLAIDAGYFGETAAEMESLGFSSLWVFDAVGRGFILPDPLTVLAVAATTTTKIELGTGVLQLPWRSTPELAYRVFTTHLICGGRLLLGVGPGSTEHDFTAMGADYATRFEDFKTQLSELRETLQSGTVNGRDLAIWPAAQGGPQLLIGAWRGPWVAQAAIDYDGWVASAAHNDDEVLADAIGRFRSAGGRRAIVTNVQAKEDLEPTIERLKHLRELGFDDAVLFDLAHTRERGATVIAALGAGNEQ